MELTKKIQRIFNLLKTDPGTLPTAGAMKIALIQLAPPKGTLDIVARTPVIKLYVTASVEMWHRAIHSYLISSALTNVSPLWASVAGYYSSHYTIRAIAHLIGVYQLWKNQYTVTLEPSGSGFVCHFSQKKTREHSFYWKLVKDHDNFINDDLFTDNPENSDVSDSAHRNFATYVDHINNFKLFNPLNYSELKDRIDYISKINLTSYPIPNKNKYPDLESVQIVAYHRLVYYRELIDQQISSDNNFWNVHRNPSWCRGIINFQRVKPSLIDMLGQSL